MDLETNYGAVRGNVALSKEFRKGLTVDLQYAYGSRLEEGIRHLVDLGVGSVNLEDCDRGSQKMYS